jgi:hypothetical protein
MARITGNGSLLLCDPQRNGRTNGPTTFQFATMDDQIHIRMDGKNFYSVVIISEKRLRYFSVNEFLSLDDLLSEMSLS